MSDEQWLPMGSDCRWAAPAAELPMSGGSRRAVTGDERAEKTLCELWPQKSSPRPVRPVSGSQSGIETRRRGANVPRPTKGFSDRPRTWTWTSVLRRSSASKPKQDQNTASSASSAGLICRKLRISNFLQIIQLTKLTKQCFDPALASTHCFDAARSSKSKCPLTSKAKTSVWARMHPVSGSQSGIETRRRAG